MLNFLVVVVVVVRLNSTADETLLIQCEKWKVSVLRLEMNQKMRGPRGDSFGSYAAI